VNLSNRQRFAPVSALEWSAAACGRRAYPGARQPTTRVVPRRQRLRPYGRRRFRL